MGTVNRRLESVFAQVKTGVAVPVIVEVRQATPALAQELGAAGLQAPRVSAMAPFIYGRATEQVARAVARNPMVITVSYDEPVYQRVPGPFEVVHLERKVIVPLYDAVSATGAPALWERGLTGKGVRIAVVDTGVNQSHRMIVPGLKGVYSAVPGEDVEDVHSHGTWCAGAAAGRKMTLPDGRVLVGAAPAADLYALKALSKDGTGQMSWVMDCMEKAVTNFNADVISMSLGSLFDNGGTDPISKMVNHITFEHKVICCIAAGNSFGPLTIGSPGGAVGALTVGAISLKVPTKFSPSTFSSKGPTTTMGIKPDISAPGGNLLAPTIGELILGPAAHEEYAYMAGTSMATPQVAGCMALLRQANNNLTRADVERMMLIAYAPKFKDTVVGFGPMDVKVLLDAMDKPAPAALEMQATLASLQAIPYYPFTLLPKPEGADIQEIRLPSFTGD